MTQVGQSCWDVTAPKLEQKAKTGLVFMAIAQNSERTLSQAYKGKAKSFARLCKITSVGQWAHGGIYI